MIIVSHRLRSRNYYNTAWLPYTLANTAHGRSEFDFNVPSNQAWSEVVVVGGSNRIKTETERLFQQNASALPGRSDCEVDAANANLQALLGDTWPPRGADQPTSFQMPQHALIWRRQNTFYCLPRAR